MSKFLGNSLRKLKSVIHSAADSSSHSKALSEKDERQHSRSKPNDFRKSLSERLTEELLNEPHETVIPAVRSCHNREDGVSHPHDRRGSCLIEDLDCSPTGPPYYEAPSGVERTASRQTERAHGGNATRKGSMNKRLSLDGYDVSQLKRGNDLRRVAFGVDDAKSRTTENGVSGEAAKPAAAPLSKSAVANGSTVRDNGAVGDFSRKPSNASPSGGAREEVIAEGQAAAVPPTSLNQSKVAAKDRWKRLKNSVVFANHISANFKPGRTVDLLDEGAGIAATMADENAKATETEGTRESGNSADKRSQNHGVFKAKGKAGLDGLIVKQDKSLLCRFNDFYVKCLKLPTPLFVAGVFSSPVILGLLFTPFYLLDIDGLQFHDNAIQECPVDGGFLAFVSFRCSILVNVFLYALSLSTTFGGSPIAAISPYALIVANLNTLVAQLLFVFLSGAVFARMSQPGQSVRCSRKAIIRKDDIFPSLNSTSVNIDGEKKVQNKVFAMRLVLTGPDPCELVDVKICLTFRIFLRLPSGSIFCSTHDLPLVRSEVAYLRYGLMCRHIIDEKSPVYGLTKESLLEGDASFSITVVGMERTSMQSIFHIQDYFVYDGDVVWDGDYHDFVYVNEHGVRVLDHSKLDHIKYFKVGGLVSTAITRMSTDANKRKEEEREKALSSWEALRVSTHKVVGEMGEAVSDAASSTASSLFEWFGGARDRPKEPLSMDRSGSFTRGLGGGALPPQRGGEEKDKAL